MTATVEIYISLSKYSDILADKVAERVNAEVYIQARDKVAKKTGRLKTSIASSRLGKGHYMTSSSTPYAAAQEWGRPDLASYKFTPYMRPAAIGATESSKLQQIVRESEEQAKRGAKV